MNLENFAARAFWRTLPILCALTLCAHAKTVEIEVVTQQGSSGREGQTIDGVLKNLREGKFSQDDVVLTFHEGRYPLTKGILLNSKNAKFKSLALIGAGAKSTVLTGGVAIESSAWTPLSASKVPNPHSTATRHGVWFEAPLEGNWVINQNLTFKYGGGVRNDTVLVAGEQRLTAAHLPHGNFHYFRVGPSKGKTFEVVSENPLEIQSLPSGQVIADGLWKSSWQSDRGAATLTKEGGKVYLARDDTSTADEGQPFFVQSAAGLEGDENAFFLDAKRRKVLLWRKDGLPPRESVLAATVSAPLLEIRDLKHVTVKGLSFECGQCELLKVVRSDDVTITHASFRFSGTRGLNLDGSGIKVVDCTVQDTGAEGIYLTGGDRKSLTPANSLISHCQILNTGLTHWSYHSGIQILNACGVRVEGNTIKHAPHAGILFTGNDIRILGNTLEEVCQSTNDIGAIYTGGDWSSYGNLVEGNTIQNIHSVVPGPGVNGIYLDRASAGVVVSGNTLAKIDNAGIFVNGGRNNRIANNQLTECGIGILVTDAAKDLYASGDKTFVSDFLRQRVGLQRGVWKTKYPDLEGYPESLEEFTQGEWLDPVGTEAKGNKISECIHAVALPEKNRRLLESRIAKSTWKTFDAAVDLVVEKSGEISITPTGSNKSAARTSTPKALRPLEIPDATFIVEADPGIRGKISSEHQRLGANSLLKLFDPLSRVSMEFPTGDEELWIRVSARSGDALAPRNVPPNEYSVFVDGQLIPVSESWSEIAGPFRDLGGVHWGNLLFGPVKTTYGRHKLVIQNWIPWLAVKKVELLRSPDGS